MPTFTMPKSFDDIEKPVAMPEGIYKLRSTKPAEVQENKKKTGMNLVIELATFGETDPKLNGRTFMNWSGIPTAEDANQFTKRGQSYLDFKLDRLRKLVLALGGSINGADFSLPEIFECRWAVIQKLNPETGDLENELSGDPLPL